MIIIFSVWSLGASAAEDPVAMAAPEDDPDALVVEAEEVVVVTGSGAPERLSDAVVATEVIDREAIEASGAATLDQLLETLPGIQLQDGFRGPGLSLRGHDPRHTLLLVDGRRVLGQVGGSVDLRRFTTDRIERIEIVRGPTSAIHGADALGGVIQIITRDADAAWFAEVGLGLGGFVGGPALDDAAIGIPARGPAARVDQGTLDVAAGFEAGDVGARAGLSLQGWDPWDRDPTTAGTTGDGLRVLQPTGRLTWDPGPHALSLDLEGLVQEGFGVDEAATGAITDRLSRTETWGVGLGGRFALPRGVSLDTHLDASGYRDQLRVDQRGSDALDRWEETVEHQSRVSVHARGWVGPEQRHQLHGGVEGLLEWVRAARIDPERVERQRGSALFQHTWRILDAPDLVLLWGARLELDSLFGVFPVPRVALRFSPHEVVRIRVAGGMGYRAPDFRQLFLSFANPGVGYTVQGNPDLRPEQSLGGTVDVEVQAHELVRITLSGWHDAVRDLIVTDLADDVPGEALYRYQNVGRARVQGFTAAVDVAPGRLVGGSLSWTFTDADDLDRERPLPGRAEHQATATVQLDEPRTRLRARVGLSLLGPRAFYPTDDLEDAVLTDILPLLDARVGWRATEALELHVGVDNALDAGRTVFDATRPRRVYGGLRVRLAPRPPSPSGGET